MPDYAIFGLEFENEIVIFAKFHAKMKLLKSWTKNALFGCFGQKL